MHSWHHLVRHAHRHGNQHRLLYTASLMILFWSLFDGILTYILPLMIVEHGFSKTEMGVIIGTSSLAGALFDLYLGKFLRSPRFRRLYLSMFILSGLFAFLLFGANTVWLYIAAMAVWGFYWDLYNFASADFVSKTAAEQERSSAFGVMDVFKASGKLIAPIIAGLVVGTVVDAKPFVVAAVMLVISILFYISLSGQTLKRYKQGLEKRPSNTSKASELAIWRSLLRQLLPVLVLTLLMFITDAFFWTLGPLVAQDNPALGDLGGLFLVSYLLPPLLGGWFIGKVTQRFGKKRTAMVGFLIGSLIISTLAWITNPFLMLVVVFVGASFLSMTFPAIYGAFSDYISETTYLEKEIQSIADLFYNLGWFIGPMLAGFAADRVGDRQSFTILGIVCVVITLGLFRLMPKRIKIKVSR